VAVLDGVFSRDPDAGVRFHPAAAPTGDELEAILRRVQDRSVRWLRRRGHLDDRPMEERSNEPPVQTALDACASLAMGRGQVAVLPNAEAPADDPPQTPDTPDTPAVAVERDGFNLHGGVRIEAGDDIGRERLCRYGARPPLSLERLRRLPGGRVAYRLKYVSRGRGKHRVMTAMEFMARLAALIAPPRYPLVRYAGVLGPRSAWRRDVVPRPRKRTEYRAACDASGNPARDAVKGRAEPSMGDAPSPRPGKPAPDPPRAIPPDPAAIAVAMKPVARPGDVERLSPNVLSVRHWDRLMGGALYAATPRVDWASLLRRSFDVDVMACAECGGRLRVLAVITEREPVRQILAHLCVPVDPPPLARARDPTQDAPDQLDLGLP
jgi:Putative transposase